jgi:hypothetical protein
LNIRNPWTNEMPTAHKTKHILFDPPRRQHNNAVAIQVAIKMLDAGPVDAATVDLPEIGHVHVVAYCDDQGAMIRSATSRVEFGDAEWHAKERILMAREIPASGRAGARFAMYLCRISDLFDRINIGNAGVKWTSVAKVAEQKWLWHSADVSTRL